MAVQAKQCMMHNSVFAIITHCHYANFPNMLESIGMLDHHLVHNCFFFFTKKFGNFCKDFFVTFFNIWKLVYFKSLN